MNGLHNTLVRVVAAILRTFGHVHFLARNCRNQEKQELWKGLRSDGLVCRQIIHAAIDL